MTKINIDDFINMSTSKEIIHDISKAGIFSLVQTSGVGAVYICVYPTQECHIYQAEECHIPGVYI